MQPIHEPISGNFMIIREAQSADLPAIRALHEEAFGEPEGKAVAQLACDLLVDTSAQPLLCLVAQQDDSQVAASILFTPVKVSGQEDLAVYILAPLAVMKHCQGAGIGTRLIKAGLSQLQQRGAQIVLVLGDPAYYSRTGFRAGHNIKPPYPLDYPEAWMALELVPGKLDRAVGVARCASALSSPEHW